LDWRKTEAILGNWKETMALGIAAFVNKVYVKVCIFKCISVATKTANVSEKKDQRRSDLKCFEKSPCPEEKNRERKICKTFF
jgi:hypothetical protein